METVRGKVILITGGARGIGLALAEAAVEHGARAVIADIDGEAATDAAVQLGHGSLGFRLDVTRAEDFEEVFNRVEDEAGPVDVLVNNAGIAEASPRVADQSLELIDRIIEVNLKGTINGTLLALKRMERRGSGQIVNVASQAGRTGVPALAAYSASKFGVVGFTDSVRFEYRGSGVTLTCVMPGPAATELMEGTRGVPLIRLITPEAVAAAIIDSIEKGHEDVFVPKSTGYLVRFAGMLPPRARQCVTRLSGIHRVYAGIDPDARSKYSERVGRQVGDKQPWTDN